MEARMREEHIQLASDHAHAAVRTKDDWKLPQGIVGLRVVILRRLVRGLTFDDGFWFSMWMIYEHEMICLH